MGFDYSKLRGRIVEKYRTQEAFSAALGVSNMTLSLKLKNKHAFKQNEIAKACELLEIDSKDIPLYFFKRKVL